MLIVKIIAFLEVLTLAGLFIAWQTIRKDEGREVFALSWLTVVIIPAIFFAGHPYVYLAIPLVVVPLCATTPRMAITAYLMMQLLVPTMPTPFQFGGYFLFSITSVDTAGLGLGLALLRLSRARLVPRGRSFLLDATAAAICVCFLILSLTGDQGVAARSVAQILLSLVIPYIAFTRLVRTAEDVRHVLTTIIFCGCILGIIATYEGIQHWALYLEVYNIFADYNIQYGATSLYNKIRGGFLRAPATFAEATSLGLYFMVTIISALAVPGIFRTRVRMWLVVAVLASGLFMTVSRGAMIGLIVGTLAMFAYRGWSRGSATVTVAILALMFGVFAISGGDSLGPAGETAGLLGDSGSDYRREFIRMGMELIRAHPLTGVPQLVMDDYMSTLRHEGFVDPIVAYVYWGARLGVFGALMLLLSTLVPAAVLLASRRSYMRNASTRVAAAATFGILLAFTVEYGLTAIHDRVPIWMLIWIALAQALQPSRRASRSSAAAREAHDLGPVPDPFGPVSIPVHQP